MTVAGLRYYEELAQESADALRRREELYPALIEKGTITAEAAATELRVWAAIAADWHWIVYLERRNAPVATIAEKVAAIQQSVDRANAQLRKEYDRLPNAVRAQVTQGRSLAELNAIFGIEIAALEDAHYRRDRFDAMLAWQQRTGVDSIEWLLETNLALRAQADRQTQDRAA